ncbi:uncharacterized protein MYCFIDRAFT_176596 [Pseudocercospora fijiensis CIRAD86]|uniref:Secreted protein n=1 Tax=Pseudocercospora fijiensis (strain CIRAD86) TaxID=383855 RepID=M3AUZ8_PSEFD|nr:uncharacterized protein MYCFIDRAFT_176596 [Pseudocercospora fijiensis CIRAD86]EME81307.1 hypothetical protein MYCFIDRAFT_176596 [Pseudocercospora fijiensis CIRAD86]
MWVIGLLFLFKTKLHGNAAKSLPHLGHVISLYNSRSVPPKQMMLQLRESRARRVNGKQVLIRQAGENCKDKLAWAGTDSATNALQPS